MNLHLDGDDENGSDDIENQILDQVEEATGVSFDDDEEIQKPETEEQDPAAEEATPAEPAPAQATKPQQNNQRDRSVNPEIQRWINARRHTDYDYDANGSVVDKKSGKVVFEKGTPAREMFSALKNEQFERSKVLGQAQQLFAQFQEQKQQLDGYTRAFEAASKSGLKLEDQALAMQMMVAYRANPVMGLRKMLHDFQVEGGDLTEIFDDLPKIQLEGLEGRLKQYADRIEAPDKKAQEQNELINNLNREVQAFFGDNPEAELHADTLAHIINSGAQRGEKVSLSTAWTRLLRFCNANGLRIDASLKDQLPDQNAPAPQPQRRQAPPPSRPRSNGLAPRGNNKPAYDRSNRDTVREAMEEAGFDFSTYN